MEENWVKATEKRIFYRKVKAVENQIKRNTEKTLVITELQCSLPFKKDLAKERGNRKNTE